MLVTLLGNTTCRLTCTANAGDSFEPGSERSRGDTTGIVEQPRQCKLCGTCLGSQVYDLVKGCPRPTVVSVEVDFCVSNHG